ncbi:MAG: hypothetical protein HY287_16295 [Planctomycetes bacterium]|nr:hypothetical protein [Planctomycetota bacterium]MBI3835887.1 hypothetical protein [Planctomycetota bacterium]
MKDGTLYASRLKKAYQRWKLLVRDPEVSEENDDPVRRLALGIFGGSAGHNRAQQAIDRILEQAIDWNEVRVSLPAELHRLLGDNFPDGLTSSQRLVQALQSVYEREHKISLERLKNLGRREARQYLEALKGVDDFAAAGVMLWSLGGHSIPIDDRQWQALKDADLVHASATRGEVQAFLERHIGASDARRFCVILQTVVTKRIGSDSPKTKKSSKKKSAGR